MLKTDSVIFFDTSVLISALISKTGASYALLESGIICKKITSRYCIKEIDNNISKFKNTGMSLSFLQKKLLIVEDCFIESDWTRQLPSKDMPILSTAIYHKANYLVTLDKNDFGIFFGKKLKGIVVLTPRDLLQIIRN